MSEWFAATGAAGSGGTAVAAEGQPATFLMCDGVLTERGVVTHADLVLAAVLASEHGRWHQPGAEPKCPRCRTRE